MKIPSRKTWRDSLKVGDAVAINYNLCILVRDIIRITPTQIIVEGQTLGGDKGNRFSRKNGLEIGKLNAHASKHRGILQPVKV